MLLTVTPPAPEETALSASGERRFIPPPALVGFIVLLLALSAVSYAAGRVAGPVAPGLHRIVEEPGGSGTQEPGGSGTQEPGGSGTQEPGMDTHGSGAVDGTVKEGR